MFPTSPHWPVAPSWNNAESDYSGIELAQRIAAGKTSAREAVEACLARVDVANPALHAFVSVFHAAARHAAQVADRRRARGGTLPPFLGVPTAVKDHHMVRFTRTRLGSRAFDWLVAPVDDPLVKRLRAAGFIIVGKTSMSELGLLPIVEPAIHPPTRNAWDPSRTAGGSSGGAGAALGAGLVPLAPGSDGAGSVRIPAALNGLLGLKPTRGLVPDSAPKINIFGLATVGPMGRSVDDVAALLDVLAGQTVGTSARAATPPASTLRIGLFLNPPHGEADPRILACVEAAARIIEQAGHRLEARTTPSVALAEFVPLYQRLIAQVPVPNPKRLQPVVRWFRESGLATPDHVAWERFHRFQRIGARAMEGLDVAVMPTIGIVPPRVGEYAHLPPEAHFEATAALGKYTALFNVTGQPALTVPCGIVDGIPVGVQLIGHHGDDALLLGLARLLAPATNPG